MDLKTLYHDYQTKEAAALALNKHISELDKNCKSAEAKALRVLVPGAKKAAQDARLRYEAMRDKFEFRLMPYTGKEKTINRAVFESMSTREKMAYIKTGGLVVAA